MLITENFALLNILQTLEKLSAASKGKKTDESVEAEKGVSAETPSAAASESKTAAPAAEQSGGKSYEYTQNLLERHERLVNNIKNGKRQ